MMNPAPPVKPFESTSSASAFEMRVHDARRGVGVANMMFFAAESHADLVAAPSGSELSYALKETSTLKVKQYLRNENCWHVATNQGIAAEFDLDYEQAVSLHERLGLQLSLMKPERRVQLKRTDV